MSSSSRGADFSTTLFDEQAMQEAYIDQVYNLYCTRHTAPEAAFISGPTSSFPLATVSTSHTEANRSMKGQQRLNFLRVAAAEGQAKNAQCCAPPTSQRSTTAITSRKSSLLDRIKAKQAINATIAPPTAEELARQRGRERAPEVYKILMMLRLQRRGQGVKARRVSIPLSSCLQMIQDSAPSPISDEEVRLAIRDLASSKGGEVSVDKVGGVEAVCLSHN